MRVTRTKLVPAGNCRGPKFPKPNAQGQTYLANVTVRVMQLDSKLELVSDADAPRVCILQTLGQGLGQRKRACELVAFRSLIDNFQRVLLAQLVLIGSNGPGVLVGVAERLGIVGIQG